jgi:hypothetical protein
MLLRFKYVYVALLGNVAPAIVGIDWRLDYSIRSKSAGRENVPVFFVAVKVKDRGLYREIKMFASLEELQDMLSKVFCARFSMLSSVFQ